jgi:hypothetical protein
MLRVKVFAVVLGFSFQGDLSPVAGLPQYARGNCDGTFVFYDVNKTPHKITT